MADAFSLKYNKSVLLLPESTSFKFTVKVSLVKIWHFTIKLTDDTTKETAGFEIKTGGKNVIIELNRWYSDSWIENLDPIVIKDDLDISILLKIKIRVAMNSHQPFKNLIISVWQKQ